MVEAERSLGERLSLVLTLIRTRRSLSDEGGGLRRRGIIFRRSPWSETPTGGNFSDQVYAESFKLIADLLDMYQDYLEEKH